MSPEPLTNTSAKLARADEHLHSLDCAARTFGSREPYSITTERKDGAYIARLTIREWPPLRLGVILGDVFYNWRSALDNMIHSLIRANNQTPTRRNSFPVLRSRSDYNAKGAKYISGISAAHAAIIESLQPYPDRTDATISALALVNAHCNADKHAAIHPTFGAFTKPEDAARSIRRESVTTEFRFEFDPVGFNVPLQDGMTIARITPVGDPPQMKPRLSIHLPVEIAFGERGLALKAFPAIRWHIHAIVSQFRTPSDVS